MWSSKEISNDKTKEESSEEENRYSKCKEKLKVRVEKKGRKKEYRSN